MNKQRLLRTSLYLLLLALTLSCSKPEALQPAELIQDTYWHGLFKYPRETIDRVVVIHFMKDNEFVWQDITGSYNGSWRLNDTNDKVTIAFKANGIQTSFALLGTNELARPENLNHSTWVIAQSLRKIESANESAIRAKLPKTLWIGQQGDHRLGFNETEAGKVTWYYLSGTGPAGSAAYSLNAPVIVANEARTGRPGYTKDVVYMSRFFGVFINEKTLRVNMETWWDGYKPSSIYVESSQDFSLN